MFLLHPSISIIFPWETVKYGWRLPFYEAQFSILGSLYRMSMYLVFEKPILLLSSLVQKLSTIQQVSQATK